MREITLQDVKWSTPYETLEKGMKLISRRVGIIKNLANIPTQIGDLPNYSFGILPANTSVFYKHKFGGRAGGASRRMEDALAATIGETIERYCAIFYNKENFIFSNYLSLKEEAIHPDEWALFSESQYMQKDFPFSPFTEKSKIYWVRGFSLIHNKFKLVPARFVYLALINDDKNIGYPTSTGLAGGNTLEEAILIGLYEVIERDAFVIFWLNRLPMPILDIENIDLPLKVNKNNGFWRFINITTDVGIPVIFGINIGPFQFGTAVGVGAASRLAPKEALLKVILEISQARPYLRYEFSRKPDWKPAKDFSNITSFEDHALVYSKCPELMEKAFSFFIKSNKKKKPIKEMPNLETKTPLGNIKKLLEILNSAGYDVIVVNLTTPDIEDIGLHVVRVIVPGFIPLHGNHLYPFLGGKRLYEVPKKLGYNSQKLNPYPHPFP
jgi:ribosomal protein S12 methylthiotransferase accessory factor